MVILNNGVNSTPSSAKAYIRFINITNYIDKISINAKLTGADVVYFSYRKPYDFYGNSSTESDLWSSIQNQTYNTTNSDFTAVTPGNYNVEIYLSNSVSYNPNFTLEAGKKYTILVRSKNIGGTWAFYYNLLKHN